MTKLPIVGLRQQLLVKVQRDVVLHQDRFGRRAVRGVLGHLSELELRDAGIPLSNGLAKRCVKRRRIELFS